MATVRTLVTGGAGFVGSHLCDVLLGEGHSVVVADNLLTGRLANLAHLRNESRFEFLQQDVCQPFDCGRLEYVFHLASPASPVRRDRKSTRLNSSHQIISYASFS